MLTREEMRFFAAAGAIQGLVSDHQTNMDVKKWAEQNDMNPTEMVVNSALNLADTLLDKVFGKVNVTKTPTLVPKHFKAARTKANRGKRK